MVGQQLTPEERNSLVMAYERLKGGKNFMPDIVAEYQQKFPGVPVPHRNTIRRLHEKQNKYFTTHNLNSVVSQSTYQI